jgi:hypothetical protein
MVLKAAFENWPLFITEIYYQKKLGKVIIGTIEMDKYGFKISKFSITGHWEKK